MEYQALRRELVNFPNNSYNGIAPPYWTSDTYRKFLVSVGFDVDNPNFKTPDYNPNKTNHYDTFISINNSVHNLDPKAPVNVLDNYGFQSHNKGPQNSGGGQNDRTSF